MEITKTKYNNVVKMLKSPEVENQILALTIVNELTIKDNITKILLLKKHSLANNELWEENAPLSYAYLKTIDQLDLSKPLSYNQILSVIIQLKVSTEQFDFYMSDFSQYLLTQIQHMGYAFVDDIEIKTKFKTDGQSSKPSESM